MAQAIPLAANGNSTLPLIYAPINNFNRVAFTSNVQYQLPSLRHANLFARGALGGWILSNVWAAHGGGLSTITINGDPGWVDVTSTLAALEWESEWERVSRPRAMVQYVGRPIGKRDSERHGIGAIRWRSGSPAGSE